MMLTAWTLTPKSSSTAWRTWVLWASWCARKEYFRPRAGCSSSPRPPARAGLRSVEAHDAAPRRTFFERLGHEQRSGPDDRRDLELGGRDHEHPLEVAERLDYLVVVLADDDQVGWSCPMPSGRRQQLSWTAPRTRTNRSARACRLGWLDSAARNAALRALRFTLTVRPRLKTPLHRRSTAVRESFRPGSAGAFRHGLPPPPATSRGS